MPAFTNFKQEMKSIIPVASGKGGVGKSTVACNLALALADTGAKVALIDADLYGPSIPTLMGGGKIAIDHEERLIPAEKHGVKYVSLAFFLQNPDDPVIWRGPMFTKALNQLFNDVSWGDVDYCIVDLPPGTGDAQLSLCQMIQITGAIMVTTPQEVAMADVRKAISMFHKVNVDLFGIVENMTGDIFGQGGGELLAEKYQMPLLASIPLDPSVCKQGDAGEPVYLQSDSPIKGIFKNLALQVVQIVDKKLATTSKVNIIN